MINITALVAVFIFISAVFFFYKSRRRIQFHEASMAENILLGYELAMVKVLRRQLNLSSVNRQKLDQREQNLMESVPNWLLQLTDEYEDPDLLYIEDREEERMLCNNMLIEKEFLIKKLQVGIKNLKSSLEGQLLNQHQERMILLRSNAEQVLEFVEKAIGSIDPARSVDLISKVVVGQMSLKSAWARLSLIDHELVSNSRPTAAKWSISKEDEFGSFFRESSRPRETIVFRHGERLDTTLKEWRPLILSTAFENRMLLPERWESYDAYEHDTPLTGRGMDQILDIGHQLEYAGRKVYKVFSSPALRCIQTAHALITGMERALQINVENGLLEQSRISRRFMTLQELKQAGFNINMEYKSYILLQEAVRRIGHEELALRNFNMMMDILRDVPAGKIILVVGHRNTYDAITHRLRAETYGKNTSFSYGQSKKIEEKSNGLWEEVPINVKIKAFSHLQDK